MKKTLIVGGLQSLIQATALAILFWFVLTTPDASSASD